MPRLHQIQLRYDAQEDRGLLRISTLDKCEYQFWITRRFAKMLWPILVRMLESTSNVVHQVDETAKSAVLSFEHQKATSRTDFTTKYRDDATRAPLGESPLLLAKVEVKSGPGRPPQLGLHPMEGSGVELAMDDKLLHSLCTLLSKTAKSADWNLELSVGEETPTAGDTPRRLN